MTEQTTAAEARRLLEQAREALSYGIDCNTAGRTDGPAYLHAERFLSQAKVALAAIDDHLSKPAEALLTDAKIEQAYLDSDVDPEDGAAGFSAGARYAAEATQAAAQPVQAERRLSPFDAVARAMDLASLLAGSVGQNDVQAANAYSSRLRSHLVEFIYPAAAPPAGERSPDAQPASTAFRRFHVGAQNDALYIISGRAPALNNDYPNHEADRTCIAKVFDEGEARRLVSLANRAIDGAGERSTPAEPDELTRMTSMGVSKIVRAKTLLALLWRKYDAAGTSMGRSHESVLLEAAQDLLGTPDACDLQKHDADPGSVADETRTFMSDQRAAALGFATPPAAQARR